MGTNWSYFIEHPEGNTLVDQGSHYNSKLDDLGKRVDFYFMGVANKKSLNDLIEVNIARTKPKVVVPLHFLSLNID